MSSLSMMPALNKHKLMLGDQDHMVQPEPVAHMR
jgi:hypothetical protein